MKKTPIISIAFFFFILAATSFTSQAQLVWSVGLDDDGWPVGDGGGANASFVQENGTINDLPGVPDSLEVNQQADNDYYFAGVYTNVIASSTNLYADYTPVGVVAVNEEAAERAFAAADNDLRYHFNLPSSLQPSDRLSITFDPLNLDDPSAANTDPRYGIEVYFNGVLVQPQILIHPVDLNTNYTTPLFSLASVNAQTGPGFDNIVSLRGINYNAEGGGNWMGIDYVQLNAATPTGPPVGPPAFGDTIQNGLVAYWNFDGNLLDSVKDFDGTARGTNPVAFVTGKAGFGKSLKLDGGNQFVEITGGNENELEFPGGSMSIAGWFKVGAFDTDWQALIAKGEDLNYRVARRAATGTIAYAGGVGEGADDVPAVNDGNWHHFVAISDAATNAFGTALYVDGALHGVNAAKPVLAQNSFNLMIGENPGARGREFEGELDDIGIWNRVLTPAEIAAMYNGGTGTPLGELTGPKIGLKFGSDQPNSTLAAADVAGAPGVAQANWNNLRGQNGTNSTVMADSGAATAVTVIWDSNNTWASTGIGEENNRFPTNANRTLMTGYLDTGDPTTSHVTITNIPDALASSGYDLYVYALGGVQGRGGSYRILDAATKAVLRDYVPATSISNATTFVEVPQNLAAGVHGAGNYLVIRGLTASGITIEGTTIAGQGSGSPARAPINAVQLVPAATVSIPSGLVAYWNFDGNVLESLNGFDGTARGTNPVEYVDAKAGFGKSIKLNGNDQFVEITGNSENRLEFPGGSMSIAGWFKVGAFDTDWQALIAKGEDLNYRVARRAATGTIAYAGGVGEGADDVPAVNDGNWHHFVAVSDAATNEFGTALYVDGVRHGVMAAKPVLAQNAFNLMIGENPGARGREFEGEIDDVAIWNRVLTPAEITTLYDAGLGIPLSEITVADQDVTRPGDTITSSHDPARSPAAELVANAIDNNSATKYLNFGDGTDTAAPLTGITGFTVTPSVGASIVTGIALTTANDAPERDPKQYKIEGSNDGTTFTLVSEGTVATVTNRFFRQKFHFANTAAYTSYRVTFPTVVNGTTANSMQVAEVELLGTAAGGPTGPEFTGISVQGNNVVITWAPATAVLESATVVTGPYTPVAGATGGTYSAPLTDAQRYFRLK